jgi:Putative transposase/Transposase zinc-binding domain
VTRPPFEVADIVRRHGDRLLETAGSWATGPQRRVLRAIAQCRTAALGGHRAHCEQCAQAALSYNSCRDRHCPKGLTAARNAWVAAREAELLPVGYVHIVFTMPEPLARLALANKRVVYDLLFQAAAATLLQVAANPKRRGAAIGGLRVLHTWGQRLQHHPHVHCVVPMGGLAPDGARWIHARPRFFLPIPVLRKLFRGKLVAGVRDAFRDGRLDCPGTLERLKTDAAFRAFLRSLYRQTWVVYAKPPFGSPAHVLHYLARDTHRVAISNHRLVDMTDDTVSFRWKDYRHGRQLRTLTLAADEFLRRFLLHVLPKRFVRIRYFGFLASRCRTPQLAQCRQALTVASALPPEPRLPAGPRLSWPCPRCGAPMRILERLTARQLLLDALLADILHDTSEPSLWSAKRQRSRSYVRALEVCLLPELAAHARSDDGLLASPRRTDRGVSTRPTPVRPMVPTIEMP